MKSRKQKAWVNTLLNNIALETADMHEQAVMVQQVVRQLIKEAAAMALLAAKENAA